MARPQPEEGRGQGQGASAPPAVERSPPKPRGPGSGSCPVLSRDRGPESLVHLPKVTQLRPPVAVSLLCHLPPNPESQGLLAFAWCPCDGGQCPFTLGGGLHRTQDSRGAGQSSHGTHKGSPGRGQRGGTWGRGRGSWGMAGPQGACGQAAMRASAGDGSGRNGEASSCSETVQPLIVRRGSDSEGHPVTEQ